jgi:hypothetical protein
LAASTKVVPYTCHVCHKTMNRSKLVAGHLIRQGIGIAELIKRDYLTWTDESYMCPEDLNTYRNKYVREMLETDKGELSKLETELERKTRSCTHTSVATAFRNSRTATRANGNESPRKTFSGEQRKESGQVTLTPKMCLGNLHASRWCKHVVNGDNHAVIYNHLSVQNFSIAVRKGNRRVGFVFISTRKV